MFIFYTSRILDQHKLWSHKSHAQKCKYQTLHFTHGEHSDTLFLQQTDVKTTFYCAHIHTSVYLQWGPQVKQQKGISDFTQMDKHYAKPIWLCYVTVALSHHCNSIRACISVFSHSPSCACFLGLGSFQKKRIFFFFLKWITFHSHSHHDWYRPTSSLASPQVSFFSTRLSLSSL